MYVDIYVQYVGRLARKRALHLIDRYAAHIFCRAEMTSKRGLLFSLHDYEGSASACWSCVSHACALAAVLWCSRCLNKVKEIQVFKLPPSCASSHLFDLPVNTSVVRGEERVCGSD